MLQQLSVVAAKADAVARLAQRRKDRRRRELRSGIRHPTQNSCQVGLGQAALWPRAPRLESWPLVCSILLPIFKCWDSSLGSAAGRRGRVARAADPALPGVGTDTRYRRRESVPPDSTSSRTFPAAREAVAGPTPRAHHQRDVTPAYEPEYERGRDFARDSAGDRVRECEPARECGREPYYGCGCEPDRKAGASDLTRLGG